MITHVKGSLFESPAKVLVNTVNVVGVMGKGIAKIFKEIYPEMFNKYQRLCENRQFEIGKLWLYKTDHKWILNFPTKDHWRQPSRPEYIEKGLKKFVSSYSEMGITSVAFPCLGCGNGELDWKTVVQPLMMKYLEKLPIDTFIYEYNKDFTLLEHKYTAQMQQWLRNEPKTLAFVEFWNDIRNIIGHHFDSTTDENSIKYRIEIVGEEGIKIEIGSKTILEQIRQALSSLVPAKWRFQTMQAKDIFIPQEAMLDLWQNVRSFGFCLPRTMPPGLDILAPYIIPLMAKLPYLKSVKLSTSKEQSDGISETALQLFPMHMTQSPKASAMLAVHPV